MSGEKLSTGERVFHGIAGTALHLGSLVMHGSVIGIAAGVQWNYVGNAHLRAAIEGESNKTLDDIGSMDG